MKNASKRGSWSHWDRFLFIILGLVVAVVVGLHFWFRALDKNPEIFIPKPTPPIINAFTYYKAAGDSVLDSNKIAYAWGKWNPAHRHSRDPDDHPYSLAQQEALVKENAGAIQMLHMGLRYPYQEPTGESVVTGFPTSYSKERGLARLLALETQVKMEQGDWDGAMASSLDSIQMGDAIPHGGGLIGMLVGVACESMGRRRAWEVVAHLNATQARAAARRLEAIRIDHVSFATSLQESKWKDQAYLQEAMRKPNWAGNWGSIVSWNDEEQPSWQQRSIMLRTLMTGKRTIMLEYTRYMDQLIVNAKQPYAAHPADPPIPSDLLNQRIVSGSLRSVWFDEVSANTQNVLLLTMLALRAYQLDHGAYPATLSALTPVYLKAIPNDPFALSGPLRYKQVGKNYLLYSVGPDGKDDGGRPSFDKTFSPPAVKGGFDRRYWVQQNSQGDIVAGVNTT